MVIELEASAPGYQTRRFQYEIKRRRNKLVVTLEKLDEEL